MFHVKQGCEMKRAVNRLRLMLNVEQMTQLQGCLKMWVSCVSRETMKILALVLLINAKGLCFT